MATQKKVAGYVTVGAKTYGPGEAPSAEDAKLIDNPKAWTAEDAEDASDEKSTAAKKS